VQLKKSIFGEVIDHLEVDHIKEILIPLPDKVLQNNIGNLSLLAYQKRDEANKLENELIKNLMKKYYVFHRSRELTLLRVNTGAYNFSGL